MSNGITIRSPHVLVLTSWLRCLYHYYPNSGRPAHRPNLIGTRTFEDVQPVTVRRGRRIRVVSRDVTVEAMAMCRRRRRRSVGDNKAMSMRGRGWRREAVEDMQTMSMSGRGRGRAVGRRCTPCVDGRHGDALGDVDVETMSMSRGRVVERDRQDRVNMLNVRTLCLEARSGRIAGGRNSGMRQGIVTAPRQGRNGDIMGCARGCVEGGRGHGVVNVRH